jgi:hypothetical protein
LLELDAPRAPQILANRRLRYQNLDFKELSSPARVSCDDYCEAILRVWIVGAQGQMSHDLAGGLWICVRCNLVAQICTNPSAQTARLWMTRCLEAGPHLIGTGQRERFPVFSDE